MAKCPVCRRKVDSRITVLKPYVRTCVLPETLVTINELDINVCDGCDLAFLAQKELELLRSRLDNAKIYMGVDGCADLLKSRDHNLNLTAGGVVEMRRKLFEYCKVRLNFDDKQAKAWADTAVDSIVDKDED